MKVYGVVCTPFLANANAVDMSFALEMDATLDDRQIPDFPNAQPSAIAFKYEWVH